MILPPDNLVALSVDFAALKPKALSSKETAEPPQLFVSNPISLKARVKMPQVVPLC